MYTYLSVLRYIRTYVYIFIDGMRKLKRKNVCVFIKTYEGGGDMFNIVTIG